MATEKQLDYALEERLRDDEVFRSWFLSKTQKARTYTRVVMLRSDHPWGKVRTILTDEESGALETRPLEGETDVLMVLEDVEGKRLALHIENKLATGAFTPYQPEMYAARAEAWRKTASFANYDDWETVLVAPRSFAEKNCAEARKFMSFISHEELAERIPSFADARDA